MQTKQLKVLLVFATALVTLVSAEAFAAKRVRSGALVPIEGTSANDVLSGTRGRDVFALRSGGGHDVILNFNLENQDRVLLDYGSYSDIIHMGNLYDGLVFNNFINTATISIHADDVNEDGVVDTVIQVNQDSITILGYAPNQLPGWVLFGG